MTNEFNANPYSIEIDTKNMKLKLFKNGTIMKEYKLSIGNHLNLAPKGVWFIVKKLPFHKQFGGYFLGLNTPYRIFAIHKISKSPSISRQKKEGSIKIRPHEARELYTTVPIGTAVVIY